MAKSFITTEEGGAELPKLYQDHAQATARAAAVLRRYGMDSAEFQRADAEAGKLWRKIREMLGDAGKPWNA